MRPHLSTRGLGDREMRARIHSVRRVRKVSLVRWRGSFVSCGTSERMSVRCPSKRNRPAASSGFREERLADHARMKRRLGPLTGFLALLALGLLPMRALEAQERPAEIGQPTLAWVSLGLGGASMGLAGGAAISVQRAGHLVSLRSVDGGPVDPLGPGTGRHLTEFALMYGRGAASPQRWSSVGIGVGAVWGSEKRRSGGWVLYERKISPTPGVALEAQLNWQPTSSVGAGLLLFGNVNGHSPMGGVLFAVQVGRLR